MKINWGTGIVLAFIGFISFIMYFIITMNVNSKYDHDLVTEDYYGEELKYQNDIDKLNNANHLTENISYKRTPEGLVIMFPKNMTFSKITGHVYLYRPSNKRLDFDVPISLANPYLLIPNNRLVDGRWNLKVDWKYGETAYLYSQSIQY